MGQYAAFQKGIKLVFDELRKARARCLFNLRKEAGHMLLHKTIQRALFGAMALVMDARATAHIEWLLTKRLQALLQRVDLLSIARIALLDN